jgi:hypothetical protein
MHLKQVFQKRVTFGTNCVFFCENATYILKYLFYRCILSPRYSYVYIFEIYVKFCILWCMTRLGSERKKISAKRSWWPLRKPIVTTNIFFACFRYFCIKINKNRPTLTRMCRKSCLTSGFWNETKLNFTCYKLNTNLYLLNTTKPIVLDSLSQGVFISTDYNFIF